MSVSYENSKIIFQGIKAAGIRSLSALPETWLGLLLQRAEPIPTSPDPGREGRGSHRRRGRRLLRRGAAHPADAEPRLPRGDQRHRLAREAVQHPALHVDRAARSLGRAVSLAHARRHRHRRVLRALNIPFEYARDPKEVGRQIREAYTLSQSSLSPVALLLTRDLMEEDAVKRAECVAMLYPELDDKLVVTIMGACAQELYDLGHQRELLLSAARDGAGVVDRAGAGAASAAREDRRPRRRRLGADEPRHARDARALPAEESRPHHVRQRQPAVDRGIRLAHDVGDHRSRGDRAGAGIEHVAAVDSVVAFGEAAIDAFARNDLSVIVAKVTAVGPNHYGMDLQLPENAFRFRRWIASKETGGGPET